MEHLLENATKITEQIRYMDIRCCPYKNAEEIAPRKALMDELRAIGYTLRMRRYEPVLIPLENPLAPVKDNF